jgi:rubrerythrin
MGQYGKIKCPTCSTSIETFVALENCPVCKVYIGDKFKQQGGGTGITWPTTNT